MIRIVKEIILMMTQIPLVSTMIRLIENTIHSLKIKRKMISQHLLNQLSLINKNQYKKQLLKNKQQKNEIFRMYDNTKMYLISFFNQIIFIIYELIMNLFKKIYK